MTDIDLTAAIEAAKDTLLKSSSMGCGCCAWPDDLYQSREEQAAAEAITAALPHIIAQVEPRVKTDREAVARTIHGVIVASAQTGRIDIEVHDSVPSIEFERTIADSVLALLPGKTEQEVRAEIVSVLEGCVVKPCHPDCFLGKDDGIWNRAIDRAIRIARGGEQG